MTTFQTETPIRLSNGPNKEDLLKEYLRRPVDTLRTPAFIVDRKIFAENCANMHRKAREWGATFRAHLKTHKTTEGTRLQLVTEQDRTHAVIVSTMMEAWQVVENGLVADSTVQDILYGLPVGKNKVSDLSAVRQELAKYGGVVRLLVDHPEQVRFLEEFESNQNEPKRWPVFVKINGGQNRAGVYPGSPELKNLLDSIFDSKAIHLHGFYGHAGNSYGSTSLSEATEFLSGEVRAVNAAAEYALNVILHLGRDVEVSKPFVLSVGSTPTAHAASAETRELLSQTLHGKLELHAGNYPMLDLQQQHTTLINHARISQRVAATVISYYPGRGVGGIDEAMIDAGAIAFSKDSGPSGSYGEVVGLPWKLSRISQEHGILTPTSADAAPLPLGTIVSIVGQHACLIAAAYPWYYIVDSGVEEGQNVVDMWVPWKGW